MLEHPDRPEATVQHGASSYRSLPKPRAHATFTLIVHATVAKPYEGKMRTECHRASKRVAQDANNWRYSSDAPVTNSWAPRPRWMQIQPERRARAVVTPFSYGVRRRGPRPSWRAAGRPAGARR